MATVGDRGRKAAFWFSKMISKEKFRFLSFFPSSSSFSFFGGGCNILCQFSSGTECISILFHVTLGFFFSSFYLFIFFSFLAVLEDLKATLLSL